ncbi:MAG: ribonuclease D [bacterium]|nr:ribonuclease D [bacterium]
MSDYGFIDTPEKLEDLAKKLGKEKVIAVDTEADSFFHYYDKLCLLQVGARAGIFLIDPLALGENGLDPLKPVLEDPGVRKIFHAAEYDLYMLFRSAGIRVRNIFDTMVSAQLLGYNAVGLGALVERHFDVKLSKDQQRTDWSRRPLREAQTEYAASDVIYLIEITARLEKELKEKKRLAWAQAEFTTLEERVWPEREFDKQGYMRIKGARKLDPRELAIMREVFMMRDKRARMLDRPPFKVLGNGTLLDLAQNPPATRRALGNRKGITELVLRRMGQDLLEAVQRGVEGPEHPPLTKKPPVNNGRRRLDRRGDERLAQLKKWRARRSKELELDPGVFCPNAGLEEIAWAMPKDLEALRALGPMKGWWVDAFGAEVLEVSANAQEHAANLPQSNDGGARRNRRGRRRGSRDSSSKD